MTIEFISIPAIAAVVGFAMQVYKAYIAKGREAWIKAIPIIGIILGMGLGVGAFYAVPEVISAATWYSALFMGAASGATATGVHQVIKQFLKNNKDIIEVTGITVKTEEKKEDKIEEMKK